MNTVVVWFRNDLRLHDSRVLARAASLGAPLLCVYVHDPDLDGVTRWGFPRVGPHRRRFLADTLLDLDRQLQALGQRLWISRARPAEAFAALTSITPIDRIVCEHIAAPEEEREVVDLRARGLTVETLWQSSLLDPDDLPFDVAELPQVFTNFRKRLETEGTSPSLALPRPSSLPVSPIGVGESTGWSSGWRAASDAHVEAMLGAGPAFADPRSAFPYAESQCRGGESAALAHLKRYFESDAPQRYKQTRNGLTGIEYSTKFSPWLASGALSPREVYAALKAHEAARGANESTYWIWFELLWRDYFRFLHLQHGARLYRAAGLSREAAPPHDVARFAAWCRGQCGEPFIDAGMRELAATGYLSNRLRQNVASWLVNDLRCDYRAGAAWFESQLIDYDPYSNQGNWLYLAGRGTDPREGRRFDPQRQSRSYDPDGAYRLLWNGGV